MGARLASSASVYALPHLRTDAARTVLLVMAGMALDTDEQPKYFGGSVYLVERLGYEGGSEAGHRKVRRVLAELVTAGWISQAPGNRHHKRRWVLHLDRPAAVDKPS